MKRQLEPLKIPPGDPDSKDIVDMLGRRNSGKTRAQSFRKFERDCKAVNGDFTYIGSKNHSKQASCTVKQVWRVDIEDNMIHQEGPGDAGLGSDFGLTLLHLTPDQNRKYLFPIIGASGLYGGSTENSGIHLVNPEGMEKARFIVDARPEASFAIRLESGNDEAAKYQSSAPYGQSIGHARVVFPEPTACVVTVTADTVSVGVHEIDEERPGGLAIREVKTECKI